MKFKLSRGWLVTLIVVLALVIDQVIKITVKLHMIQHESIRVFDWFYIFFTENVGMAFGMEIFGKLFLTVFRVAAVSFIIYYLYKIIKDKSYSVGFIVCISFILAGAMGNIFDSLFYGEIFTDSTGKVAQLVPWGQGYSSFLYGKVVDMFYFPLLEFDWPGWIPVVGGEHFIFFSPIFNFADACISCGLIVLIIFYNKTLNRSFKKKEAASQHGSSFKK